MPTIYNKVVLDGTTLMDISDTTATASDVAQGKYFYTTAGVKTEGTASGGGGTPSITQHTILFEFNDETTSTITAYYDNTFISDAITATTPTTYNGKTVALAQLDSVTWYEPTSIPLNTQLIDYTKCLQNAIIVSSGQEETMEWYYASDYSPIATGMTFTLTCGWWTYVAFYDSSKTFIRTFAVCNGDIMTQDEQDSNLGHGTLTGNTIPSNAAYIRISSTAANSNYMSLIRTT